jgi:cytochrome b subunit of formate dehydrogenase
MEPGNRIWLATAAAVLWLVSTPSIAQEDEQCYRCHDDPELTGYRGDDEIPMYIDAALIAASEHSGLACVECHEDLAGSRRRRHAEDLEPVDCGACHRREAREQRASLHGAAEAAGDALAPNCASCHGKHDVLSASNPAAPTAVMNIPMLCGTCHKEGSEVTQTHDISQEQILEHYSMSIHGEGLFRQGLTVTAVCTSCHTAHDIRPHTDPKSSIHADNVAEMCATCHGQIEIVHRKVIEGTLWREDPGKIPTCADCHAPHEIRRVFYPDGLANKDCLTCHGDPDLVMARDGETVSLFIDEQAFNDSIHANTSCAQCHTEVTVSQERACETIENAVDCSICHAEQVTEYQASTHGTLHADNDPDAPSCQDCHVKHATLGKDSPDSPTYARSVPQLCGDCHRVGEVAATRIEADVDDIVGSYEDSVHGRGLGGGLVVTATCASCHGAHSELPPEDPASPVNPSNIAGTCGTCHHGIEERFRASVHWTDDPITEADHPTCEDCHASHTIMRTEQVGFRELMMEQCGHCHTDQTVTFFDTFHGKVSRLGAEGVAKCYDCHGTHDIMSPDDPASRLSRDNVVETCGQCHEGSHRQFAGYLTHATHHDRETYPYLFWSFWGMTALLVGTLSFAFLHSFAWVIRLLLNRDEWRAHKAIVEKAKHDKQYRRFTRIQRSMHITMMLSFFALALTGMALKFSYMAWAQGVSAFFGGFDSMGFVHRVGAFGLLVVIIMHAYDVIRYKRKTKQSLWQIITGPDSIIFNGRDLREFIQSIKWFFGRGERPNYGRYTYWEKFDYFAVGWGVIIIGTTGLVLWFPEFFTWIVPGWAVNVATIIHSDEALLAVGFIFTIHFFNTHFRPDKFPMDPVVFTGRVPLEELKYDKPDEYKALMESDDMEEHLFDPWSKSKLRMLKVFGFTALTFGLVLLALIVYTMLFGYR